MKTLLLSGQSNGIGKGDGGIFPAHPGVKVWNNTNGVTDLSGLGSAFIHANRNAAPFLKGWNNLGYHAARYMADMLDEDVRLIIVATGGLAISNWAKTGPMYKRMTAVLAAAGVHEVDAFLWHQGESDDAKLSGVYADKFHQLLTDLEDDDILDDDTPVIIGDSAPKRVNINPVLRGLAGGRIRCARLSHLPVQFDQSHFTGPALVQAGWQYAKHLHDFFLDPWGPSMADFVSAAGFQSQSLPTDTNVSVPVQPFAGQASWIENGKFKAPKAGVYRFHAQGYAGAGWTMLKLLDASGGDLQILSHTGKNDTATNNQFVNGWADLDLAEGDIVALGVMHSGGSTMPIAGSTSASRNRLSVQLLEAYDEGWPFPI